MTRLVGFGKLVQTRAGTDTPLLLARFVVVLAIRCVNFFATFIRMAK